MALQSHHISLEEYVQVLETIDIEQLGSTAPSVCTGGSNASCKQPFVFSCTQHAMQLFRHTYVQC